MARPYLCFQASLWFSTKWGGRVNKRDLERDWDRRLRALGLAIVQVARHTADGVAAAPELTELRFKLEADNRTSVLVVVKARGEERDLVGFVGGPDLETAVIALGKKLGGDAMKWREDRPWAERGGQ